MKTSSCKAKGRVACKQVQELLYKWAPDLKPGDIEVTSSSVRGEDLKLSPSAREVYPYSIEVKNQEALNIWDSLDQAESHALFNATKKIESIPVLFFRRNRSQLYVAMLAEDFLREVR